LFARSIARRGASEKPLQGLNLRSVWYRDDLRQENMARGGPIQHDESRRETI